MALELRQSLKLTQQLVMTPQLQQAIKLLQLSRLELQQAVREELEGNPVLEEGVEEEEDGRPYYENLLTRKPSLADYLESQVNLSTVDDAVREIAPYLIGNIDENGYLKVSAEETAEALGKPHEDLVRAIAKIHTLAPVGG